MMSHYGLPFEYDDHWICGALELSIETLAGTAFEIKVSPNDTIMAIKSKIQSVEGIPVSQQHLLYNLKELDNSASVRDYSIQNGATLKLVLSMRGGPISTKRLPPVDELAWRELQELMTVTRKDDLLEKLPTGSRVTVLVFRDGDQVNLLRVVENEDGSFSPLSESWQGSSIRNLFADEDPDESAKRLRENSVTMGKVQELKEKLERLSIQKKGKKSVDPATADVTGFGSVSGHCSAGPGSASCEKPRRRASINFPSGDSGRLNCLKFVRRTEPEAEEPSTSLRPRTRLLSCSKASMSALTKARKEAENIIRVQSNLSILVDSEPNQGYHMRRTPLPEIHRSPRADDGEKKADDDLANNLRKKTARSFAIVEENDLAATGICSSRSSIVTLPSSEGEDVTFGYSPMGREASASVTRSRFTVSRYVLDSDDRPKTTPGKLDNRESPSGPHRPFCESSPSPTAPSPPAVAEDPPRDSDPHEVDISRRRPSFARPRDPDPPPPDTAPPKAPPPLILPALRTRTPPPPKKRPRCRHCKRKLNITNAYTCRCGRIFCAVHRYSEVHDCVFDYKEEGRRILQQTNPLVAAPKLPKI